MGGYDHGQRVHGKRIEESFGQQVEVGNVLIKAFTDEIPAAELTSLKIEGFDANGQPAGEGLEVGPSETQITIPADMEYVLLRRLCSRMAEQRK